MSLQFYLLLALGLGNTLVDLAADWVERRREKRFRIGGES